MKKTCNGCYVAITGTHPMYGEPRGCELGYKTDGHGKPLEECLKPKTWKRCAELLRKRRERQE